MDRESIETDELFVPVDAARATVSDSGRSTSLFFPPPTATTEDGLLCVGGRLTPEWLLDAYRHGIFPWPMWADDPIAWWSPDPRAIIELNGLHISRRLRRTIRGGKFQVSCDRDFRGVIQSCATAANRQDNTWLLPNMIAAYWRMHELGHAHSIEVWHEGSLVGGTYGIAIGGLFAAESMFHHVTDASKVGVAALVAHLRARSFELLDIQQWTPHTGRLGAIEIPRTQFLQRLERAVNLSVTFGEQLQGDL